MTDHKMDENINDVLGRLAYYVKEGMAPMYSAMLHAASSEGNEEDRAAIVMRSYYYLRRLAGNLEEAANLDAPLIPPQENDDIIGLCAAVTERAQDPAKLLGLTLEFKSERASHIIAVDAQRVERLLLNLLSNAFKFTPAGGKVTVEVRVTLRHVELHVSDTGCGISAEKMETLFDGYRRRTYPDVPPGGFGLGLPICRKIASDHGGTLVISSPEGEGTSVVATLENRKSVMIRMNTWMGMDYSGGFNRTLLELVDALPSQAFQNKMID